MHLQSVPKLPRLLFPFIILVLAFVSLLPTNSKAQAQKFGDLSADKNVQVAVQQSPTGTPMPVTPVPPQYADLVAKAQQKGSIRVIVALNAKFQPEGTMGQSQIQAQRTAINNVKAQILTSLSKFKATARATNWVIPSMALKVDEQALRHLIALPQVMSIQEDMILHIADDPSNAVIGVVSGTPLTRSVAYDGTGQTVAILDTGVQADHPYLAGKVVNEACFSTDDSVNGIFSLCLGGPHPAQPCTFDLGECSHGTHVSGIAAGLSGVASDPNATGGVAPGANILAVQVFSEFTFPGDCNGVAPCPLALESDIISGLNYVYSQRGSLNISSVNLSLGGGFYSGFCDTADPSFKAAVDTLRSVNIATIIASGNSFYSNGISFPACISSAISVGATDDLDNVAAFSNSDAKLSLLAPGVQVSSSVAPTGFESWDGTSMATPQVTGAWAALRQEFTAGTVSQLLGYLQMTGQPVLDPRNGLIKPRIQVDGALSPTSGPASKLAFTTQPQTVPSGKSMSSAVNVAVEDASGHRVYTDNSTMITLAIGTNPGGGILTGTVTKPVVNGVATFTNLAISKPGTGYTLVASSAPVHTGAISHPFNVIATSDNDLFAAARSITALPYHTTQGVQGATVSSTDPSTSVPCGDSIVQSSTVWYRYTSLSTQTIDLDTIGSNYDTILAVYTGTEGHLTNVACNDDIDFFGGNYQSALSFPATSGTTYQILVAKWGSMPASAGTFLSLNMTGPQIDIAGPGPVAITNGGSYDMGTTTTGTPLVKTITINNIGTEELDMALNAPTKTGAAFSVGNFGSTAIAPGGSTTFDLTCQSSTSGSPFSGTVTIVNNDSTRHGFQFGVKCTVTPAPPSGLGTGSITQTGITLNWTDNSTDETAFKIERSPDGTNWTEIASVAANQTSYPDTLLECGKLYSYRVRAYRSSDNTYSAYSNPVSATTLGCSLTKVILVDPPDTTLTTNNSPQFSWSNTGANEYQIQIDNNSDFSSPERDMVVTTNSATPSALVDGTTYSWRVRGLSSDHSQAGLWSDVWTVSIDRVRLAAPTLSLPANYANIAVLTPSFSWLAVPGATQYQLQVDDDADFSSPLFTRTPKVATYVTLATDPSLQFNKTYYWRVSAGNASNVFGNWSSVRSFTTTILKTPTNGAFSTSATPMFTWSAVTGATGYDFEVTSDPTFLTTPNDSSTGLALSHTIPTLPVNHSLAPGLYYWHVRAKIGAAVGPWMLPWTLTITPTLPVAPLLNLPLTGTQTNDTTPDLSWHPTTALVGSPFTYQVQIATTPTFYGPVQDVVQSGTTYTATTLTDGVYYWRVRTINTVQVAGQTAGHASGPWSLVRSFTVDTTPPPAPTLVAPKDWSATMSTRPAFSWLAPAGAKHYTLQVFNDTNCISPLFNVPNLITTTYTIPAASTALLPGSYCWNVQAFDVLGNPPATSTNFHFTVNASAIPLPATPTLTGPANGTSATQFGTLTLTWTVSDASTKFQLQIDTTSAFSHPVVDLAPYNNTNYAASSISTPPLPAGVYYWRVRAINSQNVAGAYSAVRNFMKQYTAPPAPNLLTPAQNSSMTSQHPTLTWQAVTGAKTYVVTVADNTLWMFPVVDHKPVLAPVVSYTLTGVPETLVYGKTYYWQVQAVDAAGNTTPQGPIFHFTVTVHMAPANGSSTTLVRPTFQWQAVAGASHYTLLIANDAVCSDIVAHFDNLTVTLYTIPPASPPLALKTYYWCVQVTFPGPPITTVTMPGWKLTVTAGALGVPVLTAPATNAITNDNTPTFSWKVAANAQNYEIQIATSSTFVSPEVDATTTPGLLFYTPTALADGKYYWRVRSINTYGAVSAWTAAWTITVDTVAPAAPVLLGPADLTTTTNPNLTLRWNTVTGAAKYEVQLDSVPPLQTPPFPVGNVLTYIVTKQLTPGTYTWQVRAIDAAGNVGLFSTQRSFTIVAGMSSQAIKPTPTDTPTPEPTSTPTPSVAATSAPTVEPSVAPTFAPPTNTPVAPSPAPVQLVTVEAESNDVARTGNWTAQNTTNASGGSYLYSSSTSGDALTLGFSGTHLDIVFVKHPAFGSFAVEVDGVLRQTVDAHAPQTSFGAQVSFNDLTPGVHTLRVYAVQGTIALDAFRVEAVAGLPATPTLAPTQEPTVTPTPQSTATSEPTVESSAAPTLATTTNTPVAPTPTPDQLVTVEAESEAVVRSGSWTVQTSASASGGNYMYSSGHTGDAIELGFSGTQATIIYVKQPNFGSFAVEVDGVVKQSVVASAPEASFGAEVSVNNLTPGIHILRVYTLAGAFALDAFRVEAVSALPATPIPSTAPTLAPTTESTAQATVQDTVQPTASATEVAATPTDTPSPTDTPTVQPTQIPPTATIPPTETPTAIPTDTPLPTAISTQTS